MKTKLLFVIAAVFLQAALFRRKKILFRILPKLVPVKSVVLMRLYKLPNNR